LAPISSFLVAAKSIPSPPKAVFTLADLSAYKSDQQIGGKSPRQKFCPLTCQANRSALAVAAFSMSLFMSADYNSVGRQKILLGEFVIAIVGEKCWPRCRQVYVNRLYCGIF